MRLLGRHADRVKMIKAWARHDAATYQRLRLAVERFARRPLGELAVLDLGCGANAPMTVLLHAAGCRVTGVDAHIGHRWGLGFRPSRYVDYVRQVGVGRTLRKAIGELTYDRAYFRELALASGMSDLTDEGLDLRQMDVQAPDLPVGEFGLIHSNATWEHIPDVRAANLTVARALKPGGLAHIEIHLFPSLSGGHDLPWIVPGQTILGDVRPWGHLRDSNWVAPVYLNRLKEQDYREAFEATEGLEILDWQDEFTEGQDLLTDGIRRALPDFTVRDLTTRSIVAVLRRNRG